MIVGPLAHGAVLAVAPHELAVDGAVIVAVTLAVARGDHLVEAEVVGQGLDQVVGRRRGQHELTPGAAVLVEQAGDVGLHERFEGARRPARPACWAFVARPVGGEGGGLAGEHHRRKVLAEHVEGPEDQVLAGQVAIRHQPDGAQRRGDGRTAGPRQQRAVQVEEGGGPGRRGLGALGRLRRPSSPTPPSWTRASWMPSWGPRASGTWGRPWVHRSFLDLGREREEAGQGGWPASSGDWDRGRSASPARGRPLGEQMLTSAYVSLHCEPLHEICPTVLSDMCHHQERWISASSPPCWRWPTPAASRPPPASCTRCSRTCRPTWPGSRRSWRWCWSTGPAAR